MSKCKCRCECCRPEPDGPTFAEATEVIRRDQLERALRNATVISDAQYRAYERGLALDTKYTDVTLSQANVENLTYRGKPVISISEYRKVQTHVTP